MTAVADWKLRFGGSGNAVFIPMFSNLYASDEECDERAGPFDAETAGAPLPAAGEAHSLRMKIMSYLWMVGLVIRAMPRIAFRRDLEHFKLRVQLLVAAVRHASQVAMLFRQSAPALQRIARERPEAVVGPLLWSYLCASWSVKERLRCISDHYRIVGLLDGPFPIAVAERLVITSLDEIYPGLRVVIDQPHWLIREGGLTLNLFVEDFRAYSLAFSFMEVVRGRGIHCLIGSVQGRNTDEAKDLYRQLTKAAYGLRPRDLLIELCRMLCRHWQVQRLLGVRDSERYDRHPFFGGHPATTQDYDRIWQDRGGVEDGPYFYALPLATGQRDTDSIKPNKRSLYRSRYRFLDKLEADIVRCLPDLQPQRFVDR